MAEGSLIGSLDRIEAALGRIEAQMDALDTSGSDTAVAALEQRHYRLRTSVEGALARIDDLIAEHSE